VRRRSREFVLQLLFLREYSPDKPLKELVTTFAESFAVENEASEFGLKLLLGLERYLDDINSALEKHSKNWPLHRMSLVDRNLLRMAAYELLFMEPPQPPAVAINEAVELAKKYGSEDSPAFINGILDQLARNSRL
jgi:N utilization substance protein B